MKKVMSKQSTKYFNHYYYHHGPAIYIQSTYYPPKSSLSAIEAYSTYIMLSQGENPYIPTTTSLLQNLSNGNIFFRIPIKYLNDEIVQSLYPSKTETCSILKNRF